MIVRSFLAVALFAATPPAWSDMAPPAAAAESETEAEAQAQAPQLPPTVRQMIDDAFATGNDAEIAAVVKFARRAHPEFAGQLNARLAARNEERQAARQTRLAQRGALQNWSGRGEVGASRASGNVDNLGIYASLNAAREGLRWRHQARASVQIQEINGFRTQERLLLAYEPHYKVNDRLSTYALLQAERDPPLGFDARYSASVGLGYALVKTPRFSIDLQGGPAFRHTEFTDGLNEDTISGRGALDARLRLRPGVTLTQTASAFIDSGSNTFASATGLETQIIGALSARLSYNLQYESEPVLGRVSTDTQSRVTLVYGF
jgi:putative salt-induced outer membrane protein